MENFIFCAVAVAVPYFNIRHDFKTFFFLSLLLNGKNLETDILNCSRLNIFTQKILSFMRLAANGILPGRD